MWDFARGCMRTYLALAAKARRFADDPQIQDALAECGAAALADATIGRYTSDAAEPSTPRRSTPTCWPSRATATNTSTNSSSS